MPSRLRESSYRVAVWVVVISCHLGLLLLLRPVIFLRDTNPVAGSKPRVLKLRFFHPSRPSSPPPALPARGLIAAAVHRKVSARSPRQPAVQPAAPVDARPDEPILTSTPPPDMSEKDANRDGGFQERLRLAQHAGTVHGVPGSDIPSAAGIHFIDPMSQGIAAVMRTTQRAFGIANSHCVDVDVWRHLTEQQLNARHLSRSDVDKVDRKYECNRPPGLRL